MARRSSRRVSGSALACAAVVAAAGCGEDRAEPAVGPAPLRRLSNREYVNALADLFPDQAPTLPALPADADVAGFENAAEAQQPSDVRIARFEAIANLYAAGATRDAAAVRALVGCDSWATPAQEAACARQLIERTGRRLFRRPVTAEEQDRFALRFAGWTASIDFPAAVQLTLAAMLQSPQFLYRPEPVAPASGGAPVLVPVEPYAMASRLSFFLWESVPDEPLLDAAAEDRLRTEGQVRAEAERMVRDPRARRVLWDFHRQWLGLERVLADEHQVRTPAIDPGWTARTPAAAVEESRRFVEQVAPGGTLRDLLISRRAWVNGDLARIYGVAAPLDPAAWQEVELPQAERAGLLTRAAFLAGTSHRGGTSPPIRGNAIQLRMLCRLPVPPPPGADLSMPVASPEDGPRTNRMLFEARTAPPPCQTCHVGLNGLGFGFEHYNAAGGFQSHEQGLAIDATGAITGTDVDGRFDGARELSAALADSEQVYRCAAQQWLRFALGRAPVGGEQLVVDDLTARFHGSGGDLNALLLDIVSAPTFRMRKLGGPGRAGEPGEPGER